MSIRLPELDSIIHYLENFQNSEPMCLNVESGTLELAVLLEAKPELLGKQMLLLPDWTSAQGYDLMLEFAHREFQAAGSSQRKSESQGQSGVQAPGEAHEKGEAQGESEVLEVELGEELHEELRRILYSRRQVFKRFRSYLREHPELKRAWLDFKRAYFFEYLKTWFCEQYPDAQDLQLALQKLLRPESVPASFLHESSQTAEDISESLLAEDFVLVDLRKESKQQYLQQGLQVQVLRHFAAFETVLGSGQVGELEYEADAGDSGSAILRDYLKGLSWVNVLELQDPAGSCAAQVFWCWKGDAVQVLQVFSDYSGLTEQAQEQELEDYILEKYLLECFLSSVCPKLDVAQVYVLSPVLAYDAGFEHSWLDDVLGAFSGELEILCLRVCRR